MSFSSWQLVHQIPVKGTKSHWRWTTTKINFKLLPRCYLYLLWFIPIYNLKQNLNFELSRCLLPFLDHSDNDLLCISNIQTSPAVKCIFFKSCSSNWLICYFYDERKSYQSSRRREQNSRNAKLSKTWWTVMMWMWKRNFLMKVWWHTQHLKRKTDLSFGLIWFLCWKWFYCFTINAPNFLSLMIFTWIHNFEPQSLQRRWHFHPSATAKIGRAFMIKRMRIA